LTKTGRTCNIWGEQAKQTQGDRKGKKGGLGWTEGKDFGENLRKKEHPRGGGKMADGKNNPEDGVKVHAIGAEPSM